MQMSAMSKTNLRKITVYNVPTCGCSEKGETGVVVASYADIGPFARSATHCDTFLESEPFPHRNFN